MIRRRVVVSGRVQGVFFRDSCRDLAEAEGVVGWVRNWEDGSVEAVFEGEAAAVDELLRWVGEGPAQARVEHVEVTAEPPRGEAGFTVR